MKTNKEKSNALCLSGSEFLVVNTLLYVSNHDQVLNITASFLKTPSLVNGLFSLLSLHHFVLRPRDYPSSLLLSVLLAFSSGFFSEPTYGYPCFYSLGKRLIMLHRALMLIILNSFITRVIVSITKCSNLIGC